MGASCALDPEGEAWRGRPRNQEMCWVINGIFYFLRTGCAWRIFPHDFPKWSTVYSYFRTWRRWGVFTRWNRVLVRKVRLKLGSLPLPQREGHPFQMVLAWCEANQLVLAHQKVDPRSNEITAIPKLLRLLDLTDRIVTIDAISWPKWRKDCLRFEQSDKGHGRLETRVAFATNEVEFLKERLTLCRDGDFFCDPRRKANPRNSVLSQLSSG